MEKLSRIKTNLTVTEIQFAIYNSRLWDIRSHLFVPNVSWGLFDYELDFAIMTRSGYVTEIEIKRSYDDFLADFKKKHTHNDERVSYFYYCIPECLKERVEKFLIEKFPDKFYRPAVLLYTEEGYIKQTDIGNKDKVDGKHRKLFLEEQLQLARLGNFRFWNLLEKDIKEKNNFILSALHPTS